MVWQGLDWISLSTMVSTIPLWVTSWWFLAKVPHYSSTQHCVCLDQCTLLDTAAWLPQCLIMGLLNGMTGFRLDLIVYNGVNNTTFESRVGDSNLKIHNIHPPNIVFAWISAPSTQQLDCPQYLVLGISNGMTGFRLDFFIVYNGLNNTTFE